MRKEEVLEILRVESINAGTHYARWKFKRVGEAVKDVYERLALLEVYCLSGDFRRCDYCENVRCSEDMDATINGFICRDPRCLDMLQQDEEARFQAEMAKEMAIEERKSA